MDKKSGSLEDLMTFLKKINEMKGGMDGLKGKKDADADDLKKNLKDLWIDANPEDMKKLKGMGIDGSPEGLKKLKGMGIDLDQLKDAKGQLPKGGLDGMKGLGQGGDLKGVMCGLGGMDDGLGGLKGDMGDAALMQNLKSMGINAKAEDLQGIREKLRRLGQGGDLKGALGQLSMGGGMGQLKGLGGGSGGGLGGGLGGLGGGLGGLGGGLGGLGWGSGGGLSGCLGWLGGGLGGLRVGSGGGLGGGLRGLGGGLGGLGGGFGNAGKLMGGMSSMGQLSELDIQKMGMNNILIAASRKGPNMNQLSTLNQMMQKTLAMKGSLREVQMGEVLKNIVFSSDKLNQSLGVKSAFEMNKALFKKTGALGVSKQLGQSLQGTRDLAGMSGMMEKTRAFGKRLGEIRIGDALRESAEFSQKIGLDKMSGELKGLGDAGSATELLSKTQSSLKSSALESSMTSVIGQLKASGEQGKVYAEIAEKIMKLAKEANAGKGAGDLAGGAGGATGAVDSLKDNLGGAGKATEGVKGALDTVGKVSGGLSGGGKASGGLSGGDKASADLSGGDKGNLGGSLGLGL